MAYDDTDLDPGLLRALFYGLERSAAGGLPALASIRSGITPVESFRAAERSHPTATAAGQTIGQFVNYIPAARAAKALSMIGRGALGGAATSYPQEIVQAEIEGREARPKSSALGGAIGGAVGSGLSKALSGIAGAANIFRRKAALAGLGTKGKSIESLEQKGVKDMAQELAMSMETKPILKKEGILAAMQDRAGKKIGKMLEKLDDIADPSSLPDPDSIASNTINKLVDKFSNKNQAIDVIESWLYKLKKPMKFTELQKFRTDIGPLANFPAGKYATDTEKAFRIMYKELGKELDDKGSFLAEKAFDPGAYKQYLNARRDYAMLETLYPLAKGKRLQQEASAGAAGLFDVPNILLSKAKPYAMKATPVLSSSLKGAGTALAVGGRTAGAGASQLFSEGEEDPQIPTNKVRANISAFRKAYFYKADGDAKKAEELMKEDLEKLKRKSPETYLYIQQQLYAMD